MAIAMASRAAVHWFWRDLRLVCVLLVWAAFAASLVFYFGGGTLLQQATAVAPPAGGVAVAAADKIYTGSIRVIPPYGGKCWQMLLDNRTGRMWGYSELDCKVLLQLLAERRRHGLADKGRMGAISSAFRNLRK